MATVRTWRPPEPNPYPNDVPEVGWEKYVSYQNIINTNNGEIDEQLLEHHIQHVMYEGEYDWIEIIPVDFSILKPGDRIRYTTLTPEGKHLFRTGGWITHINEDPIYLAYRAHTQTNWCLQFEDCQRLFVIIKEKKEKSKKSKKKKEENAIPYVIFFKKPLKAMEHNSYLKDIDGKSVLVGSFPTISQKKLFESTKKFKKATNGDLWDFKDGELRAIDKKDLEIELDRGNNDNSSDSSESSEEENIYFNEPNKILKFNSYLTDSEGDKVIVGSFKYLSQKTVFESTNKFKRALEGAYWEFKP
jgi:hypothetical protein